MVEFFIDVARECFNIGNFNSLMAIICKLSCFLLLFFIKRTFLWIYVCFCSKKKRFICFTPEIIKDSVEYLDKITFIGYFLTACKGFSERAKV